MEAHRARGILLEVTDNYEEAIREFEQALSYNDNIADLHLRIGLNYRAVSASSQAIDAFTRADVLNPADPYPDLYISRTYAGTGELPKALQYAETAVQNNPVDPRLRGNFGVMYYQNDLWKEAITQLRLAIFGGAAEDGSPIEGLSLVGNDIRLAEIYYTYGLALARTGQCGEALQIAQEIQSKIPTDETAVFNAGEMIRICEENLANPPSSTSTPSGAEATSAAPPSTTATP